MKTLNIFNKIKLFCCLVILVLFTMSCTRLEDDYSAELRSKSSLGTTRVNNYDSTNTEQIKSLAAVASVGFAIASAFFIPVAAVVSAAIWGGGFVVSAVGLASCAKSVSISANNRLSDLKKDVENILENATRSKKPKTPPMSKEEKQKYKEYNIDEEGYIYEYIGNDRYRRTGRRDYKDGVPANPEYSYEKIEDGVYVRHEKKNDINFDEL